MIEKKLVEKDIEVVKTTTTIETRLIEYYTFKEVDYLKEDLVNHLGFESVSLLSQVMDSCRTRNNLPYGTRCVTVMRETKHSDVRHNLEKLKKIIEYYELSSQLDD